MNRQRKLTALAVAMAFCAGSAFAQTSGSTGSGGSTGSSATGGRSAPMAQPGAGTRNTESTKDDKVARGDRKFIETAAEGGMFEVQVSKLATTRAQDPKVKEFASMLVDQHTKANDELVQLANAKGVELPAAPPRSKRNEIEKLGKKQGAEFDKDYVRDVGIKAHEKDIKLFEKAQKDVKDPELKAWVDKTLPTLKAHLAAAEKLPPAEDAAKMGASGSPQASGKGANKTTY